MIHARRWLLASTAVFTVAVAAPAFAQQPAGASAAAADDQSTLIEGVVVTAEKRAQNIQDIPVAVSAFTDKTRENIGIQNVQDLTNFTPGMTYVTGNDRVTLRGISRFTNNRSSEGGVAIYVDGFYSSSTTSGNLSTLFIERTEVLRGPQGTLYGRNSVGGAVNFISKRPKDEFGGEIRVGVQNYNRYDIEGDVTGPITEHLRYKLAGSWSSINKGFFKNVVTGETEGGRGDQGVLEAQFEGDALEGHFEWWLKAQVVNWQNLGRGPGGRNSFTTGQYETDLLVPTGVTINPLYGYTGSRPANTDHFNFDADTPNYISLNNHAYTAEAVYHFKPFDVKYIGGYLYYDYNLQTDVDDTSRSASFVLPAGTNFGPNAAGGSTILAVPVTIFPKRTAAYHEEPWWYSNEINITSTGDGPLQWIAGLYQFREGSNYRGVDARMPDQPQLSAMAAPNPNRAYAVQGSDNVTWSQAVFGQATYKLTDTLKLTGGLRYTWDRRKSFESQRVVCFVANACASTPAGPGAPNFIGGSAIDIAFSPAVSSTATTDPSIQIPTSYDPATGFAHRGLKNEWSATTGTLGLDWTPDDDTLYYAKYTRGYKAGGFNAGTITANPSTDPEHIDAYEVGAKKTFGARFQANASLFYYDYKDVQVPLSEINAAGLTVTNFYNLPNTTSKGFELETIWFPTDHLQILANYSYLDAKIGKVPGCGFADPQDPTARQPAANPVPASATCVQTSTVGQDLDGQQFPNSTPHRISLNGNYTWDAFGGSMTGSASYVWRSSTYSSQFNRWYNKVDSWGQADARLVWRGGKDRDLTVIGFVKNIFDEEGPVGASASRRNRPPPAGQPYEILSQSFTINAPRTYGVEVQKRF